MLLILLWGLFSSAPPPCPKLTDKHPKLECVQVIHPGDMVAIDTKKEIKAVYRRGVRIPFAQHRKAVEPEYFTVLIQMNRKKEDPPEEFKLVYK